MRIKHHPILDFPEKQKIAFYFQNKKVYGYEGDTIASALHALGVKELSLSVPLQRPRGFYCAIGNCSSCKMIVDGVPNVKTCVTPLKEGMNIRVQTDKGFLYD